MGACDLWMGGLSFPQIPAPRNQIRTLLYSNRAVLTTRLGRCYPHPQQGCFQLPILLPIAGGQNPL